MTLTIQETPVAGLTRLQPGDVVALEGAVHIVERTTESSAWCIPLLRREVTITNRFTGKETRFDKQGSTKTIALNVERDFILERRGRKGLEALLAGRTKAPAGTVELEVGDVVVWEAQHCTVWAVGEGVARVVDPHGVAHPIPSAVNPFFLSKRQPEFRNLEEYRTVDGATLQWRHKPISPEEIEQMKKEAKESKRTSKPLPKGGLAADAIRARRAGKATAAPGTRAPSAAGTVSYAGRKEYVAELKKKGGTFADAYKAVCEKYPQSSQARVQRMWDRAK
jgi:hypothetical protein